MFSSANKAARACKRVARPSFSFYRFADEDAMSRIEIVRNGVPATVLPELVAALHLPKEQIVRGIGIPMATSNRRLRSRESFNPSESERIVGLVQLLARVDRWAHARGDALEDGFDPEAWLGEWLTTPNRALGGHPPLSLLDTADGRALVGAVLESMETGAYW